jgi:hypothetical protein
MSLTTLIDDLTISSENLHSAMQSGNAESVETATDAFRSALDRVNAAGPWASEPQLRDKVGALMAQLEESRALSCLLADMTAQAHEMAAARAGDTRQPLYTRSGERFA